MTEFRTLELAKKYYFLGKDQKLPYHLKEQFERSSSSIALNLAEGNAKSSKKDRIRIFEIAYGSFRESQTILALSSINNHELDIIGDQLGGSIYKLIHSLRIKMKTEMSQG